MQPNYPQAPYPQQMPPQYQAANARKHLNALLIPIVLLSCSLVIALVFALWAFTSRQDYKNNSDKKAAAAVKIAEQQTSDEKDKEFLEKEKSPYETYVGPADYGSINITYSKKWSAFITESNNSSQPIEGYLHPNFVPGIQSGIAFALRVQVLNQSYDQALKNYESQAKAGKIKVSPFKADKVPNVLGARIDGEITQGQKDSMVIFPLRDKTLKIWTESDQFLSDFNTIILPNLTFVP
jgi:hypothetical protein